MSARVLPIVPPEGAHTHASRTRMYKTAAVAAFGAAADPERERERSASPTAGIHDMLSDLAGMRTERGHVTDLWMAAAMNELDKVQLLAERDGPDARNVSSRPARSLHSSPNMLTFLASQDNGDTPLRVAAFLGRTEVVAALLGASADSTLKVQGRTAIAWAQERGQSEAEALLEADMTRRLGEGWQDSAKAAAAAEAELSAAQGGPEDGAGPGKRQLRFFGDLIYGSPYFGAGTRAHFTVGWGRG